MEGEPENPLAKETLPRPTDKCHHRGAEDENLVFKSAKGLKHKVVVILILILQY